MSRWMFRSNFIRRPAPHGPQRGEPARVFFAPLSMAFLAGNDRVALLVESDDFYKAERVSSGVENWGRPQVAAASFRKGASTG